MLWTRDLVGLWRMESVAGGITPDSSGAGLHGTVVGAILTPGRIGKCLTFVNDDSVKWGVQTIQTVLDGMAAPGITMLAHVYPTNIRNPGRNVICDAWTANVKSGFYVEFQDAKLRVGGRSQPADAFQSVTTPGPYAADNWYHIAGVLDFAGDKVLIYVEGALVVSQVVVFGSPVYVKGIPSAREERLGWSCHPNLNFGFQGPIDEFAVVGRVLTETDIRRAMMTMSPVG